jgi:RHS repeat-associated protein
VVAQVKQITSNANVTSEQTQYFHRDSLGSTSVITDQSGAVVERLAYEPFGKRRQATGPRDPGNTISGNQGQRGFTNHEHMDELGLINMNGRVYDPMTARFISADPMVEAPMNSQSYNRYSYIVNSPLNATDPSGYCFICKAAKSTNDTWNHWGNSIAGTLNHWGDVIRTDPQANLIATVAVAVITQDYVGAGTWQGAAAGGFAGGMTSSGGDLDAGLKGAATALMYFQVGSTWRAETNLAGNVAGHAAVGCISATMSGGDCGAGAVSAGIADYASHSMPTVVNGGLAMETAYVAVVGGTAFEAPRP